MSIALRILGGWAILAAVVALVNDLTHAYETGARLAFSSLLREWELTSPATLATLKTAAVKHVGTALWDPVLLTMLKVPAFAALGLVGIALYAASLRRRSLDVYAN